MRLDFVIPAFATRKRVSRGRDVWPPNEEPCVQAEPRVIGKSGVALWILAFARMTGGAHPSAHAPGPANKNGKGSLRASDAFM
jgi:hypothetical protein